MKWSSNSALVVFVLAVLISCPAKAANQNVTTTVEVRTTVGDLVPGSYVALVPLWRPWSKPFAEEIAATGRSTFAVPPGTYHVLASARGFDVGVKESFKISARAAAEIRIALSPLQQVTGTVTDSGSQGIHGVRVATVHGAIPASHGKLSALAVRHLGADWVTTTDQRGQWRLAVPEGAVPLFFEAPGHAGQWRVRTAGVTTLDVQLARGAALTITTDRADANLMVTVVRQDGEHAVLSEEQQSVWVRSAEQRVLSWKSLPAGTYDILASYPAPHYFSAGASNLATVRLREGTNQQVALSLPPARKPAASTAALFLWQVWRSDLRNLNAFGRSASGDPRIVDHALEDVVGGTVVHVRTGDARPPFYATTADQFFSPLQDIPDEHRETTSAEPWWALGHPRADAHFSVRFLEEELQPPRSGIVVLTGCKNVRRVRTMLEIKGNVGEFTAPAGCESFVLDLQPFEPVIAARSLVPGDQSLGEYVLRGAGSADVRVVRDPGGAIVPGATVRAVSVEMASERSTSIREAVTDDRGWAHLTGLPSYWKMRITAETIDGEKSAGTDLRVAPRQRASVDPLLIPTPAVLIVEARIDRAFLQRFPATRLLTLTVRPADPERASETRQESFGNAASPMRVDKLHPGRWLVSSVVSVDGTYAHVDLGDVELKSGDQRRIQPSVAPNVFVGTITSKGHGVAAKVMVEEGDRTLNFNTSATGEFRVVLQDKGVHRVAVARLGAQGNIIPIGHVSFTDPTRAVDISLPDTGAAAVRVRQGRRPLPGATVWMSRRDETGGVEKRSSRAATTDGTGEARFEDIAPGLWTFAVRVDGQRQGAEKTIAIDSGNSVDVELQTAATTTVEGTLRAIGGAPLPRARVDCVFLGPGGILDHASADTDVEGVFEIELMPPPPRDVLCSVVGPMGTVDAFRAVPGHRVHLAVAVAAAAVRFPDWPTYDRREGVWLVAQDGRAISLAAVATKIGRFGAPLEIPALAAGTWKVVRIVSARERLALASGMAASLPTLAEVTLRAGDRTTIHFREGI